MLFPLYTPACSLELVIHKCDLCSPGAGCTGAGCTGAGCTGTWSTGTCSTGTWSTGAGWCPPIYSPACIPATAETYEYKGKNVKCYATPPPQYPPLEGGAFGKDNGTI